MIPFILTTSFITFSLILLIIFTAYTKVVKKSPENKVIEELLNEDWEITGYRKNMVSNKPTEGNVEAEPSRKQKGE